jgi:hypothetical protein
MIDKTLQTAATVLGWVVLALMVVLLVGSLLNRHGGSLDDLSAAEILSRMDGTEGT